MSVGDDAETSLYRPLDRAHLGAVIKGRQMSLLFAAVAEDFGAESVKDFQDTHSRLQNLG